MRLQFANLFERTGKTSKRPAERLRDLAPCTREEVLRIMANDDDLMGMVFDQAVKAKVIEFNAGTWQGAHVAALQSAIEDSQP